MLIHIIVQLGSDSPYEAEPVDVWGIGVILFTLLAGSEFPSVFFSVFRIW